MRRQLVVRAAQAAAAIAVVVFVVLYLPVGSPAASIRYTLHVQNRQAYCGHPVWVAGTTYAFPPWWANLWFFLHSVGTAATVLLCLLAVTGIALAFRDKLTWWLLAALLPAVVYFCFISPFALPFYWTLWAPPFFALTAVAAVSLTRAVALRPADSRHGSGDGPNRTRIAAAAVLPVATVVVAGSTVVDTARLQALGAPAVAKATSRGAAGLVLIVDYSTALTQYMPADRVTAAAPANPDQIGYFAVGNPLRIADRHKILACYTPTSKPEPSARSTGTGTAPSIGAPVISFRRAPPSSPFRCPMTVTAAEASPR